METSEDPALARFVDPRREIWDYMGEVFVRCPSCDQRARVAPTPTAAPREQPYYAPRRVSCLHCGYLADRPAPSEWTIYRDGKDPYFGLPLWFTARCVGHVLWAYNVPHLELIESFVSATLRERGSRPPGARSSLVERLPSWIKQTKHRREILRAIEQIRNTAT